MAAVVLEQLNVGREVQLLFLDGALADIAQDLIGQALHAQLHAVLALHTVAEHVELQRADDADDDLLHAGVRHLEDLDGALLGDLLRALDELLALHGVLRADAGEMLRRERRDARKAELFARRGDGVADGEDAGIEHADDIPGVGLVDDLALLRHELLGLRQAQLAAALHMEHLCLALVLAGADAQEGEAVAVGLVHICLNLEDEGGEVRAEGVDHAAVGRARQGRRRHLQEGLEERLHAEVRQGRAEEHRAEPAAADLVHVEFAACTEQLDIVAQLLPAVRADELADTRIVEQDLLAVGAALAGHAGEEVDVLPAAVIDALELLAAADGPVHGVGLDAKLVFQLVEQVERVLGLAIHLVDKREDRDMAHLEQLARLRLDALAAVDDHNGGVRRHERAVGILREILMARRIEDVDAEALILELHDGGGDGNAALLFDLHPVRDGSAGVFLALDRARLRDGPAVEQEFFRQRGFAGVRVRDDRKRPAAADLFL